MKDVLIFSIVLLSALCVGPHAFSDDMAQKVEALVQSRHASPVGHDRLYEMSWRIKSANTASSLEINEISQMIEEQLEAKVQSGEFVSLAAAAWALRSKRAFEAAPLVAMLESRIRENGKLRGCKSNCEEAAALTYLAIQSVAPVKAERIARSLFVPATRKSLNR